LVFSVNVIDDWDMQSMHEDAFTEDIEGETDEVRIDSDLVHETTVISDFDCEGDDEILVASNTSSALFDSFEDSRFQELIDDNEVNEDSEYIVFPLSLEKVDPMCVRLNELIQSGRIPKHRIMYKYLSDVTNIVINPNWEYDAEVVEFFNTIKYLGGERTVNFIRGPMWFGTGKWGKKIPEHMKPNLVGPLRTTRQKQTSGYTTQSGVVKRWLCTGLELACSSSRSDVVLPFVETPAVKAFAVALENDGTALKPSIQYDEQQQLIQPQSTYVPTSLQKQMSHSFPPLTIKLAFLLEYGSCPSLVRRERT
jgi:hypothetical protein